MILNHARFAASAYQSQRAVFYDIIGGSGYIEYLPSFGHTRIFQRQRLVTIIALRRQWMAHTLSRLRNPLECRSLVTNLPADLLVGRPTQRARLLGLLGKAVRRRRLA